MKLTPKQKKFCEYYASSGNATESARKAGYSGKIAKEIGYENLTKPYLQEYIRNLTQKDEETRIITAQEMQEMYSKILRGETKFKETVINDGNVTEVEIPTKLSDWNKTSELLMRLQGAYLDRVELNIPQVQVIENIESYVRKRDN